MSPEKSVKLCAKFYMWINTIDINNGLAEGIKRFSLRLLQAIDWCDHYFFLQKLCVFATFKNYLQDIPATGDSAESGRALAIRKTTTIIVKFRLMAYAKEKTTIGSPGANRPIDIVPSLCLIPVSIVGSWSMGGKTCSGSQPLPASNFRPPCTTSILC